MRIIAGKYKRTPLTTLEGNDITRPTKDMVKEAFFSSIVINEETCFLDLFSGSGAIGLEALSRGAKEVIFNDVNSAAVSIIKKNLAHLKEERVVYNYDYLSCLNQCHGKKFDILYCDPPYKFDKYETIFQGVEDNELLNKKGIIVLEVRKDSDAKKSYFSYVLYKEKKYGITKLLYYREEIEHD